MGAQGWGERLNHTLCKVKRNGPRELLSFVLGGPMLRTFDICVAKPRPGPRSHQHANLQRHDQTCQDSDTDLDLF